MYLPKPDERFKAYHKTPSMDGTEHFACINQPFQCTGRRTREVGKETVQVIETQDLLLRADLWRFEKT